MRGWRAAMRSSRIGRARSIRSPWPPGSPAPSPLVPAWVSRISPSSAAASKNGRKRSSPGSKSCSVGCSLSPRSPSPGSAPAAPARPRGSGRPSRSRRSAARPRADRGELGVVDLLALRVPAEQHAAPGRAARTARCRSSIDVRLGPAPEVALDRVRVVADAAADPVAGGQMDVHVDPDHDAADDIQRGRPSPAEIDLQTLKRVQRRVLWLATSIVHHANRVPREPLRREGRRPPGVERVDGVADDRAVLRVLRGARPRERQAAREPGPARHQPPARPARPPLPDDAARVRRPAVLPEPHEGPRPGRLLHRLRRPRRHRADLGRARAPLRRRALRRPARRPPDRADRRRRARRGRLLGGDRRPDGRAPGRGHVGRRPQPPVAGPRRAGHRRRPPRRDVRGRRLAHGDGQVRPAAGSRARRCAPASTRCPTRSTSGCCAPDARELRERLEVERRRPRRRRAAGHLPRPRRPRPRRADRRLPPGRRGARPPARRLRLHDQGLVAAHRGPPRQPLRAAQRRRSTRELAAQLGEDAGDPWAALRRTARRRPSCARRRPQRLRRDAAARRPGRRRVPGRPRPRAHRHARPRSRRSGASSSTSCARRPRWPTRVVTVSPDVGTSHQPRRLDQQGRASGASATASTGSPTTPTRSCAGASPTTAATSSSGSPRSTSSALLGELGATWSRDGQPLLPVGTIYDPFVARALEPWSFGIYAGGQSILVGTPSGVTLGPEGGAHQSVITPSIGIEQPGCVACEPAFGQDFEWCFLHALSQLGRPGRHARLLPALHAPDRPVAAHRHARGGARRRLQAAAARRAAGRDRGDGRARARGDRRRRHADRRRGHRRRGRLRHRAPTCCSAPSRPAPASATATRARSSGCSARASRSSRLLDGHPHTLAFLGGADRAASACSASARPATSPSSTSTTRSTPSRWSAPRSTSSAEHQARRASRACRSAAASPARGAPWRCPSPPARGRR